MREYKFRGKTFGGAQWVYGSLIWTPDKKGPLIEEYDGLRHISPQYLVIPESVGQFAGRKDSQSKEMFEGDIVDRPVEIVNINGKWQPFAFRGVVYWDAEECAFMAQGKGVKTRLKKNDTVIGNIFDNPALMEES